MTNVGVPEILRITSPQARVITGIFIAVDLTLALTNLDDVYSPLPSIIAVLLVSAGAILMTLPAPEPWPLPRSFVVIALVAASTALASWNLPPSSSHGYAAWHLGANTLLLLFLGLRGRSALAWAGFAVMVAISVAWTATAGKGTVGIVQLLPNQVGTLLVGTLFAVALRRTSRTITALHARQAALASAESATRAAAAERSRQSKSLNGVARAALERIAAGSPYSEEERESWMRLEATVRDSLRAPALTSAALTAAANDARERGVEVTLLDDSAGALDSPADREAVSAAIIRELGRLRTGRLIGRVLPTGRGTLATILVDDGESTKRTDVGELADPH